MAKEARSEREAKDRQIEDLTALVDETRQTLMAEYEDKVSRNLKHFWMNYTKPLKNL